MSSTLWALTLTLALGQAPCSTCNNGGGYGGPAYGGAHGGGADYGGQGYAGGSSAGGGFSGGYGAGPGSSVNISGGVGNQGFYTGSGGTYDPLYPYDYHETWVHGHFQEIPAYGGFKAFRPYNYKHVLSQSQVAAGWGLTPTMPYSQEYFRRMQPQASSVDQRYSMYQQSQTMPTAAEIARYRAQREIPATQSSLPRSVTPSDGPHVYAELPSSAPIDPAVYVRQRNAANSSGTVTGTGNVAGKTRVEELEETVRRQQLQMQAMQGNIPPEYRQAAAAFQKQQQQQAAGLRR